MAARSGDPKKKSIQADHLPRDGMTGMSWKTQRHFIDVQQKLVDYVGAQETEYYDQVPFDEQRHHHHHHRHHHSHHLSRDFLLLDGKNSPKAHSDLSSPALRHKKLAPGGLASPQVNHRHRQPSPQVNHRHRQPSPRPPTSK